MRPSGRAPDQMRAISIEPNFTIHAEGSVLVSFGNTKVLVTASVEERVPPFLRGKGEGWVTAEYGMLPRATHTRGNREAAKGKQSGRTQEIQRLIGRSLRAVTDLAIFAFAFGMAFYGGELALRGWGTRIPVVGLPQTFTYLPIVIAGILMCLFSLERLLLRMTGENVDDPATDEVVTAD